MLCRLCKESSIVDIISLGNQKNTSIFPKYGDINNPTFPINIVLCQSCGLVQTKETSCPDELYKTGQYGYESGISNTMRKHLLDYHEEILSKVQLNPNDTVLDIGCNDGTLLDYYNITINKLGVDPTGQQFIENYKDKRLLCDYFTKDNFTEEFNSVKCKIVTSISMFYDLPDPVQFAKDIYDILTDDGIWTCEQSYLLSMLNTNSLDTICHEHLEYYALTQMINIAERANFKIIDVKFNDCNGGSFRVYFAKKDSSQFTEATELINDIVESETKADIINPNTYINFMHGVNEELDKLKSFIKLINDDNKKAYLYGASTKGNCILQYCNIHEAQVKYAVERNPKKIGRSTSTGIEIISEETMRENPPDYLIVLPWHFRTEIVAREKEFLDNGGQFIFYLPKFEIVSNKPKTLITGCDGYIGSYAKEILQDNLYGITRQIKSHEKIHKIELDLRRIDELTRIVDMIKPDKIIHLGSDSSAVNCFKHPVICASTATIVSALCEIIKTKSPHTKLFNASSSEIYKGHKIYCVDDEYQERINNYNNNHPYSMVKVMNQEMIKFYRKTYGLHLSTGILFTVQSERKNSGFLLNKLAHHAKTWKSHNESISVGFLGSYRSMIHPIDVISAIEIIFENSASDYVISTTLSTKIEDLVVELYDKNGIQLYKKNDSFYDKSNDKLVLDVQQSSNGLDNVSIDIRGKPSKLLNLGWEPEYDIAQILCDMIDKI
jgi:GDP-D-mannose dehydratase